MTSYLQVASLLRWVCLRRIRQLRKHAMLETQRCCGLEFPGLNAPKASSDWVVVGQAHWFAGPSAVRESYTV